jgi:CheY-like chemotaxis protein
MRPKKKVLIVDMNEESLGILRFLIKTQRYAVYSASSTIEAIGALDQENYDLLIIRNPLDGIEAILQIQKEKNDRIPIIILNKSVQNLDYSLANFVLNEPTNAEIMDKIAILVKRKRGPKPGTPRMAEAAAQLSA